MSYFYMAMDNIDNIYNNITDFVNLRPFKIWISIYMTGDNVKSDNEQQYKIDLEHINELSDAKDNYTPFEYVYTGEVLMIENTEYYLWKINNEHLYTKTDKFKREILIFNEESDSNDNDTILINDVINTFYYLLTNTIDNDVFASEILSNETLSIVNWNEHFEGFANFLDKDMKNIINPLSQGFVHGSIKLIKIRNQVLNTSVKHCKLIANKNVSNTTIKVDRRYLKDDIEHYNLIGNENDYIYSVKEVNDKLNEYDVFYNQNLKQSTVNNLLEDEIYESFESFGDKLTNLKAQNESNFSYNINDKTDKKEYKDTLDKYLNKHTNKCYIRFAPLEDDKIKLIINILKSKKIYIQLLKEVEQLNILLIENKENYNEYTGINNLYLYSQFHYFMQKLEIEYQNCLSQANNKYYEYKLNEVQINNVVYYGYLKQLKTDENTINTITEMQDFVDESDILELPESIEINNIIYYKDYNNVKDLLTDEYDLKTIYVDDIIYFGVINISDNINEAMPLMIKMNDVIYYNYYQEYQKYAFENFPKYIQLYVNIKNFMNKIADEEIPIYNDEIFYSVIAYSIAKNEFNKKFSILNNYVYTPKE